MSVEQVAIGVDGMSCASSARKVEKGLQSNHGVNLAVVDLKTKSAPVDFDQVLTNLRKLSDVARSTGYEPYDAE